MHKEQVIRWTVMQQRPNGEESIPWMPNGRPVLFWTRREARAFARSFWKASGRIVTIKVEVTLQRIDDDRRPENLSPKPKTILRNLLAKTKRIYGDDWEDPQSEIVHPEATETQKGVS